MQGSIKHILNSPPPSTFQVLKLMLLFIIIVPVLMLHGNNI